VAQETAVEALRAVVRLPTVSYDDPALVDDAAFTRLEAELRERFPAVFEHLEVTRVLDRSLLLHWPGAAGDRSVVLMAHLDVVPVDESAPWRHPPFGAVVADGAVWGRGTLDDKAALVAICAATERLLRRGFTPAQDLWQSFGAREEVSGPDAGAAVDVLRDRGVRPWFVLDEGGAVAHEAFPGIRPRSASSA
jgi:carboxypeptidase PM20D1